MISGATLVDYNKRYSTKIFFMKRINKTLIPFIFWSIFGLFYMLCTERMSLVAIRKRDIINAFINTEIIDSYWYFIPQFAIHLIIPFISAVAEEKRCLDIL